MVDSKTRALGNAGITKIACVSACVVIEKSTVYRHAIVNIFIPYTDKKINAKMVLK